MTEQKILEKWDNTCIKILSAVHGTKVIEFWKSVGVDIRQHIGNSMSYPYYGLFNGEFNNWDLSRNTRILTLEEAIAIRDKDIKTFPREMYVYGNDVHQYARKALVVYIAENQIMGCNVMCYDQNCWCSYKNAMEIEEYEAMNKKQNENAELIKQIEKTEKELAELKSKLK